MIIGYNSCYDFGLNLSFYLIVRVFYDKYMLFNYLGNYVNWIGFFVGFVYCGVFVYK